MSRSTVFPLDLLPVVADHLAVSQFQATLATLCSVDRYTNHLATPKLYDLMRLTSPRSLSTFTTFFRPPHPTPRQSHLLSLVRHLEIELVDTFLEYEAFRSTLGEFFGAHRNNNLYPHGIFLYLETLHITTRSTQDIRLSVFVGDPPSLPVMVGRILGLAHAKHLRWQHHHQTTDPTAVLPSRAFWAASFRASLEALSNRRRQMGTISEEIPPLAEMWECPIQTLLEFTRVGADVIDERWEDVLRYAPSRAAEDRQRLVIYVRCSEIGEVVNEGLGMLKRLHEERLVRLVEEDNMEKRDAGEWRKWIEREEWRELSSL